MSQYQLLDIIRICFVSCSHIRQDPGLSDLFYKTSFTINGRTVIFNNEAKLQPRNRLNKGNYGNMHFDAVAVVNL